MSMQLRAFRPLADTQNVVVTASAQSLTLNYPLGTNSIRVYNSGTQIVFFLVNDATSAKTATVSNAMPVAPGNTEVFTMGNGSVSLSIIAPAVGSTFYVTQGEGV